MEISWEIHFSTFLWLKINLFFFFFLHKKAVDSNNTRLFNNWKSSAFARSTSNQHIPIMINKLHQCSLFFFYFLSFYLLFSFMKKFWKLQLMFIIHKEFLYFWLEVDHRKDNQLKVIKSLIHYWIWTRCGCSRASWWGVGFVYVLNKRKLLVLVLYIKEMWMFYWFYEQFIRENKLSL